MNLSYKNNFLPLFKSRLKNNKIVKKSNLRLFLFFLFLNELVKPKVSFEIGAYDAEFSINLRKRMKDIKIYVSTIVLPIYLSLFTKLSEFVRKISL